MKLRHDEVILDFEGEPAKFNVGSQENPLWSTQTFRDLVLLSLTGPSGDQLGAEGKARCYQVATKFLRGKAAKLTVDERAFVKERAGVVLNAFTYGRVCDWLEGNPQVVFSDDEDPVEDE
jgi:hypothetical protein